MKKSKNKKGDYEIKFWKSNEKMRKSRNGEKIAMNIAKNLKKIKSVKSAILFGSYARGEERPLSDIDICVITSRKISNRTKSKIIGMSSKLVDISLFWDLPVRIRYKVLKEGKKLFKADNNFMHSIEVGTVGEYLDFKHIIDRNIDRVFQNE